MVRLDRLWSGVLAGMFVGLLLGTAARISMRIVAQLGGMHPEFSLGGTLGILILFTVVGVPFGALYAGVWTLAPFNALGWGGIYGLGWATLAAIPFLRNPGGELALASPWIGIALFATLPLLGGVLLGIWVPMLDRRLAVGKPRTIHAVWLAGFALAVALAFMNMASMLDSGTRSPRAVWEFYGALGLSFMDARDANALLGGLLAVGYTGLLVILFFLRGQAPGARLSVIVLLTFAAGFFNQSGLFTAMMDSLRLAALAEGLLKAAGATGLLLLLHTFPDGHFAWRWSRPLCLAVGIGALFWFTLPVVHVHPSTWVPESVQLVVVAASLGSGLLALIVRLRNGNVAAREQTAASVLAFGVVVLWFLGLWATSLVVPGLRFSGPGAPFAPLTVAIYLLPWLLLPATLLHATLHRKLWSVIE